MVSAPPCKAENCYNAPLEKNMILAWPFKGLPWGLYRL
jgi:hypothetical protein